MSSGHFTRNTDKAKHLFSSQLCSLLVPTQNVTTIHSAAQTPKHRVIVDYVFPMSHVKSIRKCYEVYLQAMSWAYLCICFSTTTVPASLLLPQLPLLSLYLYLPASWPFFVFCKQPCSFLPFGFPPSFVWNAILLDLGIISFLSLSPWFKCDLPPKYHSTHVTFYPKTYFDFFSITIWLILFICLLD